MRPGRSRYAAHRPVPPSRPKPLPPARVFEVPSGITGPLPRCRCAASNGNTGGLEHLSVTDVEVAAIIFQNKLIDPRAPVHPHPLAVLLTLVWFRHAGKLAACRGRGLASPCAGARRGHPSPPSCGRRFRSLRRVGCVARSRARPFLAFTTGRLRYPASGTPGGTACLRAGAIHRPGSA